MKKFNKLIASFLSGAIALSALPVMTASSASTVTQVLLGDANQDGYVTLADSAAIQQYSGGALVTSAYGFTAMDINQDKIVAIL